MIVNNKYKVYWIHTPLSKTTSYRNEEGKVTITGLELSGYNRAFSDCIINEIVVSVVPPHEKVEKEVTTGRSVVHPNDTFDRKKGVYHSFKNAMENFRVEPVFKIDGFGKKTDIVSNEREIREARQLRKDFWKEYWRIRKNKGKVLLIDITKIPPNFNPEQFFKEFQSQSIQFLHEDTSTDSSRQSITTEEQIDNTPNNISEIHSSGVEHSQDAIKE